MLRRPLILVVLAVAGWLLNGATDFSPPSGPMASADAAPAAARPRIGLALSGGGARGAAHVGVLRVLEELKIPVDYIAGTSMGSIVGALYASGMTPDEIAQALEEVDWDEVFTDATPRDERAFRRKQDDKLNLIQHKPGLKDGEVRLPMALVEGQKFDLALRRLLLPVSEVRDFDRLRIPYRAVATDIATGKEVVLERGDLAQAVRASMAVPGAFAAVDIDGRTLVDGGMANNLPISVAREMGADIVIAVDISTPLLTREEIKSVLGVVEQLTGFLTRGNTERQIESLTRRDLLIVPPLDEAGIGSGDFKRATEAIAIGERAARDHTQRLAALSVSPDAYAQYLAAHPNPRQGAAPVERLAFVEIENNSSISDAVIAAQFDVHAGDPLDVDRLEAGIARAYGLGHFEKIGYRLERRDGRHGVVVRAQEKSWGTNSLQTGLQLYTSFGDGSDFNLGGAVTLTPFGANAGEWRTLVSLGEEQQFITEVYYPLDPAQKWFVGGDLGYESRLFRLFDQDADRALAEYDTSRLGARLRFGRNLDTWGRLQLMYDRSVGKAEVTVGAPDLVDYDFDVGRLSLLGAVDTYDDYYFPSRGSLGSLSLTSSREGLGASSDYDQVELDYSWVMSQGRHALQGGVTLATTLDEDAPVEALFQLGGFMRLSGLERNALSGQHLGLLRGLYRYRLNDVLVPIYAGASLELGNAWDRRDEIEFTEARLAGSLFLAADTPLGPLFLSYGNTEGRDQAVYLILGPPW
jgi:NTE family protein